MQFATLTRSSFTRRVLLATGAAIAFALATPVSYTHLTLPTKRIV